MTCADCGSPGHAAVDCPINHPAHYRAGGIESIDVIEAFGLGFHLGNVVKYVLRVDRKAGECLEDLQKARWYLEREIARRRSETQQRLNENR